MNTSIMIIAQPADILPRGGPGFNTILYQSPIAGVLNGCPTVTIGGNWTVAQWDLFIAACEAHRADLAFFEAEAERAAREDAHHDHLPAA